MFYVGLSASGGHGHCLCRFVGSDVSSAISHLEKGICVRVFVVDVSTVEGQREVGGRLYQG